MITKDKFWNIVKKVNWEKNSRKYDLISKIILQNINSTDEIEELANLSKYYQKKLDQKIYRKINNTYELIIDNKYVFWGSDDSFWDFKAHIVSLGEVIYNSCFIDDNNLLKGKNYIENFDYIFYRSKNFAKTKEGQKILHRKHKLKKIID
jgi:hypothetical protein